MAFYRTWILFYKPRAYICSVKMPRDGLHSFVFGLTLDFASSKVLPKW